jgi:hypothetical protein
VLDPTEQEDRRLMIIAEHPEYHEALADESSPGEVDGVDPALHIAMHEIVATQLWDNDPPEAWQAAQRLSAAGIDRMDVLHALAGVVSRHVHRAMTGDESTSIDAYVADLAALEPPAPRR